MQSGDRAARGDLVNVEELRVSGPLHHLMRLVDRPMIGVADATPVLVTDAELDRPARLAQEMKRVDPEMAEQEAEGDRGRLADADDRDLARLDDRNLDRQVLLARRLAEDHCSKPARGAAAHHDKVLHDATSALASRVEYMPVVRNSVGLVPKWRRKTLAK